MALACSQRFLWENFQCCTILEQMRLVFSLLVFLFSALCFGAEQKPLLLDFKLSVEGRVFEHHDIALTPGHMISIVQRASREDTRSYSLEMEAQATSAPEEFLLSFSIARIEEGKRQTLSEPKMRGKLKSPMELVVQGADKAKIALNVTAH